MGFTVYGLYQNPGGGRDDGTDPAAGIGIEKAKELGIRKLVQSDIRH